MEKVTKKFTPKPRVLQGDLAQLPSALQPLTEIPHWVCWRFKRKPSGNGWTKPPVSARGGAASSNDPSTWCSYPEAVAFVKSGRADGIGFVITPDAPYAAIDVDGCRDLDTSSLHEWGQNFLEQAVHAKTYAEVTPSGQGIRIWGLTDTEDRAHQPFPLALNGSGDKCQVELYRRTNHYVTITGIDISAAEQLGNVDWVFDWVPR
jgi:primase-polymerase (primpol)-like protein